MPSLKMGKTLINPSGHAENGLEPAQIAGNGQSGTDIDVLTGRNRLSRCGESVTYRPSRSQRPGLNAETMPGTQTKRLFVAVFPPAQLVQSLQAAVAGLTKIVSTPVIRWTPPGNLHLTSNFLGAIEIARIPQIAAALKAACNGHRQHAIRLAGLGCFPNRSRPQIIWAGMKGDLLPLESLKKSIDAHLAAVGCACEDRRFHPHLTIGRVRDLNSTGRRDLAAALAERQDCDFGEWQIGTIDLMESVLSQQGPAYGALESIQLENP